MASSQNFIQHNPRVEETLFSLQNKPIKSTTFDRVLVVYEADRQFRELSPSLRFGHGIHYILEHIKTPVALHDLLLGRIEDRVLTAEEEIRFANIVNEIPVLPEWMQDLGHQTFAFDRLAKLGFWGLLQLCEERLAEMKADGMGCTPPDLWQEKLDFLEGAALIYRAFLCYAKRYGEAALVQGLTSQADIMFAIATRAPRSFAEALQAIWLFGVAFCGLFSGNPTITFWRMDQYLLDFYRKDLAAGTITREYAAALIEDFYCKNNLLLGRGEHQISNWEWGHDENGNPKFPAQINENPSETTWSRNLCYDSPQYILLAGTRADGSASCNELTQLFIETIQPSFKNPVVIVRYTTDFDPALWTLLVTKISKSAAIEIYNDKAIIPAMTAAGFDVEDAVQYSFHGCNWPDLPGIDETQEYIGLNLADLVHRTVLDKQQLFYGYPQSMDELLNRFREYIKLDYSNLHTAIENILSRRISPQAGVIAIEDCFRSYGYSIEQARSRKKGCGKYSSIINTIGGLGTAIDSLTAINELIFKKKLLTFEQLTVAMQNNYEGNEEIRLLCKNQPKFGQDDDRADQFAPILADFFISHSMDVIAPYKEQSIVMYFCLQSDTSNVQARSLVGATPDGRRQHEPYSENGSPSYNSCTKGVTAMFQSLLKLPFDKFSSGAMNIKFSPDFVRGETGIANVVGILRAYFEQGGLQTQISVTDTAQLRAAQQHPERYRDLVVRVTGYSGIFVDLTPVAQEMIIARDEL